MRTGALYIRVSTDDQTEYSPDAQKRLLLDYAKKNDIVVSNEYIYLDEGISGRRASKRPAFMRMIATAKQKPKPFDVILVHKFDRFSRNREDSIVYKSLLRKECGIQVISITEQIEDDKFSVILEAMLEAMAEYYSLNLSDEVKKGMTEKAMRGEYQAAAPLGYKMVDKKLVPDAETADIIRMIYDKYLNGMSEFAIARLLNDMGIRTIRGNRFDNRGVTYILQNPVYHGYVRWNVGRNNLRATISGSEDMIVAKGDHEPLISKETYELALAKKKAEYKPRKAKPTEYGKHWLSGILKCSDCGSSLTYHSSRKGGNFQCTKYIHGNCARSHSMSLLKAEAAVTTALNNFVTGIVPLQYELRSATIAEDTHEKELCQLSIDKIEQRLLRCKEAYQNGIDTLEEYAHNKAILTKELEQTQELLKKYDQTAPASQQDTDLAMMNNVGNVYEILISDIDKDDKARAIRSICEKIVYDKSNESLDFFLFFGV